MLIRDAGIFRHSLKIIKTVYIPSLVTDRIPSILSWVQPFVNVAIDVAEAVASGKNDRGILMCGTGIGMCITANKVPGVYAALCSDAYSTDRSIRSSNANIMTLGEQVTGVELAKSLVTIWMKAEYESGGRSEPKIQRIYEYAKEHDK